MANHDFSRSVQWRTPAALGCGRLWAVATTAGGCSVLFRPAVLAPTTALSAGCRRWDAGYCPEQSPHSARPGAGGV